MDRDGTINEDYGYVHKFENFKLKKNILKTLKYLSSKKVYLFIPYSSMKAYSEMEGKLAKDQVYQQAGAAYINAAFENPPYQRIETAFLS